MNKSKQTLIQWANQNLTGTGALSDTFRNLPASVAGPAGRLHRHVAALLLTAYVLAEYTGESTAPTLDPQETLNAIFGRILWTYYGGEICSNLTATELVAILATLGCLTPDKDSIILDIGAWSQADTAEIYASLLIPITPTMFSTGHTIGATDAPILASLFGASSQYTLSFFQAPPDDVTFTASIEASALCWDTPDAMVPRPIRYRRYETREDPAILPSQFCKMPAICALSLKDDGTLTTSMSNTIVPRVLVDGRPMEERMVARVKQVADAWYRDDADRLWGASVAIGMILRSPFEGSKMIEQPAGSQWSVEGIGAAEGASVRYIYVEHDEPGNDLVAYAVSASGLPAGSNSLKALTVNSNSRAEMTLTQEEGLAIPHRMTPTRYAE